MSAPEPTHPAVASRPVQRVSGSQRCAWSDAVAVEEPLAIRLCWGRQRRELSVTMRTPGHDGELAAGFLFTEGLVGGPEEILDVGPGEGPGSVVEVQLRPGVEVDVGRLERHFYVSSSCGTCGKASIAAVQVCQRRPLPPERPLLDAAAVHALPQRLRSAQRAFDRTGGLHAAALFSPAGELLCLREDVGRHNAVDKVVGAMLLAGRLPPPDSLLLVSGRASFELVQKALLAGIPILAAVGAPSSLAIDLARDRGMTVLGFVRDGRFNVYSGAGRVRLSAPEGEGGRDVRTAAVTS